MSDIATKIILFLLVCEYILLAAFFFLKKKESNNIIIKDKKLFNAFKKELHAYESAGSTPNHTKSQPTI